ncbi:MAG: hypothetical protein R2713_15485 [Ilumatobacteraceae bacterium]
MVRRIRLSEIAVGKSAGTCAEETTPLSFNLDGAGFAFKGAAMSWIDGIAQASAETVLLQLRKLRLIEGLEQPTVADLAPRTPGFEYGTTSTSARTVAIGIDGNQVAIAVLCTKRHVLRARRRLRDDQRHEVRARG